MAIQNLNSTERGYFYVQICMVKSKTINRTAQRSLFSQAEMSEKSTVNGRISPARLSTYMKTPEALWRLLATYPNGMPVADAIRRARIDFTKCRKEVAV